MAQRQRISAGRGYVGRAANTFQQRLVRVAGMQAIGISSREIPLKTALVALTALALAGWSQAAAQSYADRSWAEPEAATVGEAVEAAAPSHDTPASTLELPDATAPAPDESENPAPPLAALPFVEATPCANCEQPPNTPAGEAEVPGEIARYETQDSDFNDGIGISRIGLTLARDRRKLKSGEYARGLLVVEVEPNSPAAKAGLQPLRSKVRMAAQVATVAAAMVFPPAMVGFAMISSTQFGESYDLIVGVDGNRIGNILEFEDRIRDARPGEIAYLNVVRNGLRLQVPVSIPGGWEDEYICDAASCLMHP